MLSYSVVVLVELIFKLLSLPHFEELDFQIWNSLAHQKIIVIDLLVHAEVIPVLNQQQRKVVLGSVMIPPCNLICLL